MTTSGSARGPGRRARSRIFAALVLAVAVMVGVLGYRSSAVSFSAVPPDPGESLPHRPHDGQRGGHHRAPGEADGVVPDGVTIFDDGYPAVAKLDPALLAAVRRAATSAAGDGLVFYVDSGWRSRPYQKELFRAAVSTYGSPGEAARWVAPPGTSAHESGDAVDIGHSEADAWLSDHGATFGLCQVYGNEPWHYELRPDAVDYGCPAMYADATDDPRTGP